jgi:NAD-dependent SIR2 family protein deacetylase
MKNIAIFTGAGISKESGISTFRDSKDGLWNNYDIDKVASIQVRNCKVDTEIYYVDPKPEKWIFTNEIFKNVTYFTEPATTGIVKVVNNLMNK